MSIKKYIVMILLALPITSQGENAFESLAYGMPLENMTVAPGTSINVNYKFNADTQIISCKTSATALTTPSIQWQFKGTTYKGIILPGSKLTLKDSIHFPGSWADPIGSFKIANHNKQNDLVISCKYVGLL